MPAWLIPISLISVIVTAADKVKAKRVSRRVPEATLMLLSVLGGSLAMLITMIIIRHKTKHPKFMVGIPVIIALQIVAGCAILTLTPCFSQNSCYNNLKSYDEVGRADRRITERTAKAESGHASRIAFRFRAGRVKTSSPSRSASVKGHRVPDRSGIMGGTAYAQSVSSRRFYGGANFLIFIKETSLWTKKVTLQ